MMAWNMTEIENQQAVLMKNVDDAFLLSNGIIVCLMQCGFACLEAGSVRSKNVTNIIMKNLMDIFMSAVAYWLIGYALAYGPHGGRFAGGSNWAGAGVESSQMAHWFFQFVFAATAATIVSGAVAERCHYVAYLTYSFLISGLVYPIVSHWVWADDGWLRMAGYKDFAGAGAVHLLAGSISFVAAFLIGPRIGCFGPNKTGSQSVHDDDDDVQPAGHSTPLVGIGGMILIAGFLAFNGGSLGTVTGPGDGGVVARVMAVTVLGGAGASCVALALGRAGLAGGGRRWPFAHTLNAAFAGMVSVCAGANEMRLWAAFVSGVGAAPVYFVLRALVVRLRVDDPLDTVGVHFGGGLWGLASASLLTDTGLILGNTHDAANDLVQRVVGAVSIIAWAACLSLLMFGALKIIGFLRVSREDELKGLDESMHGEPGYPPQGWHLIPPMEHKPERNVGKFRSLAEFQNAGFEDTERQTTIQQNSNPTRC